MIRTRFMAAVRRQDWMAVSIELAVVVLGLFLGLQLNAWKEERDSGLREQAALERLQQESEAVVSYFHGFLEDMRHTVDRQQEAIAALSTGDRAKFSPSQLADRLGSLGFYPAIAPPRAVYDELLGSGLMNDIGSVDVRSSVARYYATLTFIQSQLDYFRLGAAMENREHWTGWLTRYDTRQEEIWDRFSSTADFDSIATDSAQMSQLVGAFMNQLKFQHYRQQVNETAEAMCRVLAESLHRTCAAIDQDSAG